MHLASSSSLPLMLYRSRRIFCLLGNDADEQVAQANVEVRLASQIDKASAIRGKPIEPLGEKRSRLVHHSAPQKHRDHVKLESQMVGAIGELGRNAEPQLLRERGRNPEDFRIEKTFEGQM